MNRKRKTKDSRTCAQRKTEREMIAKPYKSFMDQFDVPEGMQNTQNDIVQRVLSSYHSKASLTKNQNDTEMLGEVFQRILVRQPDENELKVLQQYYTDATETFKENKENAEKLLTQGNFENSDTDPIKTAALMLTAQVIYNLDETITKE